MNVVIVSQKLEVGIILEIAPGVESRSVIEFTRVVNVGVNILECLAVRSSRKYHIL